MDVTRPLPFAQDAEKGLLSCFLHNPVSLLPDGQQNVPPEHFYHPAFRLFYETVLELHADGYPIERVTIAQHLTDCGKFDKIGGEAMLLDLFDNFPTADHYRQWKGIVRNKWKTRRLIELCTESIQSAYTDQAADEGISDLAEKVMALSLDTQQKRERSFHDMLKAAVDRYEESSKRGGAIPGIATGWPGIDRVTGGKQPGQLWVIGGGTSDGKSAYAQQSALWMASQGTHVAIYTLEMPDDEVVDRFFSIHGRIPSDMFKRGVGTRQDWQSLSRSFDAIKGFPMHIRDVSGIKLNALIADMRLMAKRGVQHFVVDYGQLIESEGKSRSREEEVARVSRNLKALAKQLRVSVDLLSQLNDDGKLRESRAPSFDADVIVTISCPTIREKIDGEDVAKRIEDKRIVFLSKNRNGQRGVRFDMNFNGSIFTFTEQPERLTP